MSTECGTARKGDSMPDDILDIFNEPGPPSLLMLITEARDRLDQVLDAIDKGHDPARVRAMIVQTIRLLLVAIEP
jgi:hypothetical protein